MMVVHFKASEDTLLSMEERYDIKLTDGLESFLVLVCNRIFEDCRELLDEDSDIYIDEYVLSSFDIYENSRYNYDIDTKTYTFLCLMQDMQVYEEATQENTGFK